MAGQATESILTLIDATLTDSSVGPDAMRCIPADENAGLLLTVEGTVATVRLPDDGNTLTALRDAIGCAFVDVVRLRPDLDMWIDDEGVYTQQANRLATALARQAGFDWQDYFGPVVFTGGADRHGNTRPLTPGLANALRGLADF